jgi:hypothetical protein
LGRLFFYAQINLLTGKRCENHRGANFGQKCTPARLPSKDTPVFSPIPILPCFDGVGRNLPFDAGCSENPAKQPFLGK